MKRNYKATLQSKKILSLGILMIVGLLSACSNKNQTFKQIELSSESSNLTDAEIVTTQDEKETEVEVEKQPPLVEPPVEVKILSVQGLATGVASEGNADMFENWAPRGTTIQLHYSIGGLDAVSNAMQIVKRGSIVNLGQALDSSSFAEGEDGRPYAFSQYFNLEKQVGSYTFNLPLNYKMNASSATQYLKIGQYSIYITACSGSTLNTCKISNAIDFEVK